MLFLDLKKKITLNPKLSNIAFGLRYLGSLIDPMETSYWSLSVRKIDDMYSVMWYCLMMEEVAITIMLNQSKPSKLIR